MRQLKTSALQTAVRLLAKRDHSERELIRKLTQRGYSCEQTEEALKRLHERGYLNDRAFCRKLAESLWESGKWGLVGVSHQLRRHGLSGVIIQEVLEGFDREQEVEYAIALLKRRFPGLESKDKAGRFLTSRGFSYSAIEQALEQIAYLC